MLSHRPADGLFSLPGLEYTYDHLEHDIDGRTMMLHVKCVRQLAAAAGTHQVKTSDRLGSMLVSKVGCEHMLKHSNKTHLPLTLPCMLAVNITPPMSGS